MLIFTSRLLTPKVILKKFALQNLSFLPNPGINFLKKTILTNTQPYNTLPMYLNFMFFFIQALGFDNSNFIKLHPMKTDYFILKNLKFFTVSITSPSLTLYIGGADSTLLSAKGFGLFNKVFCYFSAYSNIFFSSWVSNVFFIGVGYKVFIFNNYLYLRLGFSRMLKLLIPSDIVVLTRKRNHLRIMSTSHEQLESFIYLLKNLRVFDCYKGKGIFQTSDFSAVKLKVGKKQQFF